MPLKNTSLRNLITFPSYMQLPEENDIDYRYYTEEPFTPVIRQRRHWCFLAEIVDMMTILRLRLEVKDRDGFVLPVNFHTEDRGTAFLPKCRKGYTLAVLYGEQHAFADGTVGIRLEQSKLVKVLPYSLEQILEINDVLFEEGRKSRCDCCGVEEKETKGGLKRCSRCKELVYCGTVNNTRHTIFETFVRQFGFYRNAKQRHGRQAIRWAAKLWNHWNGLWWKTGRGSSCGSNSEARSNVFAVPSMWIRYTLTTIS